MMKMKKGLATLATLTAFTMITSVTAFAYAPSAERMAKDSSRPARRQLTDKEKAQMEEYRNLEQKERDGKLSDSEKKQLEEYRKNRPSRRPANDSAKKQKTQR